MDIDKKIEELRKEFNEKVDELKREYKEKNEKWIPEVGDRYYLKARRTYSYKFSKEEWKDASILKHVIYLDTINQDIFIESTSIQYYMNSIYFKTREDAEKFINKYKKQILKFEFGIEEE